MWKSHIDFILSKLGSACFVIRRLSHVLDIDAIKAAYYSYFHSLIYYGVIFWGNSTYVTKVYLLQRRMTRIMMGISSRFAEVCSRKFICYLYHVNIYIFIDGVYC